MTLPIMPSTHRWFRGGPALSRAGRAALFSQDDIQVWVWDEQTGEHITDLIDENGASVTAPLIQDGWVLGAGLPVAVNVASFSIGKDGKHLALEPADAINTFRMQASTTATEVATDVATATATAVAADIAHGDAHVLLDTDGAPYFDLSNPGTQTMRVDTDGVPYFL